MEIYNDMKKYHTGSLPEGRDLFSIPLQKDEDGMVGRECHSDDCQPKYFKISLTITDKILEKAEEISQIDLTCPYCGNVDIMNNYYTQDQLTWVKSMITRDVFRSFQNMFKDTFKQTPSKTKGMFSMTLTYKPGPLPSVRHYIEKKLKKIVECENCGFNYAVYGISFFCPICGKGNLSHHLKRSAEIIKILLEEHDRIIDENGIEVGQHLIGNALEDVVGLFEVFLKNIYKFEIKKRYSKNDAEDKIAKIHTDFQRLNRAEELYLNEFGLDIFSTCDNKEKVFLQEQFLKRHVITHNFGIIDKKYLEKARTFELMGKEIDINPKDVLDSLNIVEKVISGVINNFQNP